jgi:hypothetical protein
VSGTGASSFPSTMSRRVRGTNVDGCRPDAPRVQRPGGYHVPPFAKPLFVCYERAQLFGDFRVGRVRAILQLILTVVVLTSYRSTTSPDGWHESTPVLLRDGRVLLFGGVVLGANLYDPVTNTWTATGVPHSLHKNASALLLPSGHVLVAASRRSFVPNVPEQYEVTRLDPISRRTRRDGTGSTRPRVCSLPRG